MTPLLVRLFALIAVFASILIFSQVVLSGWLNRRSETRAVNKRLQLLRSGLSADAVSAALRKSVPDFLPPNAGPVRRIYYRFQRSVRMSAVRFEPRSILVTCFIALVSLTGLLLFLAWASKFRITIGTIELIAGIAATATFALPIMWISRLAEKRYKKIEAQFPVAIDIFTRALRAGHPVASAIELLTNEMEDPLGSEFGMVSDEVAYGANLNDALMRMADRWDLEDMRMFVVSLSLQAETGGNLAEILSNLSGVIRDRASMYMKVRALSSEGRMSGLMLTILPALTFLSMFAVNPAFYLDVSGDPSFVIGFSGLMVLYAIGVITIRRMVDLKV
ncbi:MAG: type II secretion system F family protein [Novosphingobium sp.]